jgi:phosphatidylglycerol:prolipoprotein diacylglycerol transferase
MREFGKPAELAYEATIASLFGGLVGARADDVIENYGQVQHHLWTNLFAGSGLVWYGGLIGGELSFLAWARWRGILNFHLLDLNAMALALGYAIGRVGCQVSGDGDYGTPWHGPWAMAYPHGEVPTHQTVHPTPIYETLTMGLVAWLLWGWRDRFRPGVVCALYLVFAGSERFLVEFIRRNPHVLAGLTAAQLESMALVVIGSAWLAVVRRRGGWSPAGRPPAQATPSQERA